jgi:hypothetical protein
MELEYTSMSEARKIIRANERVILFNSFPGCTTCAPTERALLNSKDEILGVVIIKINSLDSAELLGELGARANGSLIFIKNGEKQGSLITSDKDDVLNMYRLHFVSQTNN